MLIILSVIIIGFVIFVYVDPVFGAKNKSVSNSIYYKDGKFKNLVNTHIQTGNGAFFKILWLLLTNKNQKKPLEPLPTDKFSSSDFQSGDMVWFGHSTILMNIDGKNIITDPVFYNASPIGFGGKPFEYTNPLSPEILPYIDVVLISHDHYDHLDYKTICEIDAKVGKYLVPIGVKAHLLHWNIDSSKIEEFDWYQELNYEKIQFVFAPTRHFSGRRLTNRDSTLWGSWIVHSNMGKFYFSGDTGYFEEFKKVGAKYGPFDLAFIENGAYSKFWEHVHMLPEQTIQTALDLKAKLVMPIHWGKFDLSFHAWYEPIQKFIEFAEQKKVPYIHPKIGQIFNFKKLPKENWWKTLITKKTL